jgi:hypothetical protein
MFDPHAPTSNLNDVDLSIANLLDERLCVKFMAINADTVSVAHSIPPAPRRTHHFQLGERDTSDFRCAQNARDMLGECRIEEAVSDPQSWLALRPLPCNDP